MKKGYSKGKPVTKPSKSIKKGYGKDLGKKNIPGKTGFKAIADKASAEYGSDEAGQRVAGAILKKMKASGKA
jgi:hypothetical protein